MEERITQLSTDSTQTTATIETEMDTEAITSSVHVIDGTQPGIFALGEHRKNRRLTEVTVTKVVHGKCTKTDVATPFRMNNLLIHCNACLLRMIQASLDCLHIIVWLTASKRETTAPPLTFIVPTEYANCSQFMSATSRG